MQRSARCVCDSTGGCNDQPDASVILLEDATVAGKGKQLVVFCFVLVFLCVFPPKELCAYSNPWRKFIVIRGREFYHKSTALFRLLSLTITNIVCGVRPSTLKFNTFLFVSCVVFFFLFCFFFFCFFFNINIRFMHP